MKKKEITLFLAAVVSHVFWGFSFLGTRSALDVADMYLLLSHRFLIAFLIMNLLLLFRVVRIDFRGKGKRILWPLLMGLMEPVVYFIGEEYGVLHSTTIFSGVMIAVIPIVSIIAAIPLLHEKPNVWQVVFSFVSVGGVIGIGLLTKDSGRLDWIGVVALIVSVLSAAAYGILDRGLSAEFTAFERTYLMIGMGAVCFTPIALIRCRFDLPAFFAPMGNPAFLLPVLFLSVCCSVVSYFLLSYMATYMTVTRSTVYANLTTAVSVIAGALILKEPFSWLGALFCAVILVGIYGVQKFARKDESAVCGQITGEEKQGI
ncbi:MAG: DMT family transporter [Clostridia bacterium]|nr:DMT family transporter [Clostridia bacterium]